MKTRTLALLLALSLPTVALSAVGGPPRTVPNLAGLQIATAKATLESAGMVYVAARQGEPTAVASKVGTVARQSPAAGAPVPANGAVTVTAYVISAPQDDNDRKGTVNLPRPAAPAAPSADDKGKVRLPGAR
jgi:beta-lactam-binding protein with PASTA domain